MRMGVSLLALLCCLNVSADPSVYGEIALNAVPQKVSEERFHLGAAEVRAGVYIQALIAVEAFGVVGVMEDDNASLNQSLKSGYGIGTRFESPAQDGTKAFILLGYSSHDLELTRKSNDAVLASETFDGFSYGVGLEQQMFSRESPMFLNLRWQRHYSTGGIDIDSLGVAFRFAY